MERGSSVFSTFPLLTAIRDTRRIVHTCLGCVCVCVCVLYMHACMCAGVYVCVLFVLVEVHYARCSQ